jgi:hypothetical protein
MFLPRYSLRWLLAITVACAVGFSLVALALRGVWWAAGVSVAIGSVLIVLAIHALVFGLIDAMASFVPQQEVELPIAEPIVDCRPGPPSPAEPPRRVGPAEPPAAPQGGPPPDPSSEEL